MARGIADKASDEAPIKLNQFGTVSGTPDKTGMMACNGWKAIVTHRSGETSDTFIADLVVGLNMGQIEREQLSRWGRIEKGNRLLEFEDDRGGAARFAGTSVSAGKSNISR